VQRIADDDRPVQAVAAPWPLATPAASVAITIAEASYRRGSSAIATDAAAEALRSLRRASAYTNVRSLTGGYIPFVDETGARFQLYMRDAIPPEDDHGLLPAI